MTRVSWWAGFLAVALALSAGVCVAGELKYAVSPGSVDESSVYNGGGFAGPTVFRKPGADAGTVHKAATVATLSLWGKSIALAVDARKADAKTPDVVRVDFTGKGVFAKALAIPLRREDGSSLAEGYQARFGPATAMMPLGDKTVPVQMVGIYGKQGWQRWIQMNCILAAEGDCQFGKVTRRVRLTDRTGNFKLGDPARMTLRSGRPVGVRNGDGLQVAAADGSFAKGADTGQVGQPVLVDGAWYLVVVSPEGPSVSARAIGEKTGAIRVGHERWSAKLLGTKYAIDLEGGREPVPVPADTYYVLEFRQYAGAGKPDDKMPQLSCHGRSALIGGTARPLAVEAGKTRALAIGAPLTAGLTVSQKSGTVSFSLALTDAAGNDVSWLVGAGGKRPAAPKFEVRDAAGKAIYKASLTYG